MAMVSKPAASAASAIGTRWSAANNGNGTVHFMARIVGDPAGF